MMCSQAQAQTCIVANTPPVCQEIQGQWLSGPTYVNCGDKLIVIGTWQPAGTYYLPVTTSGCAGSGGSKAGPKQYAPLKYYSVVDCTQQVTNNPTGDSLQSCNGYIPDGSDCQDTCGG